jgi:hypothetical protein
MDASRLARAGAVIPEEPNAPVWAVLPNIPLLPKISPLARLCEQRGLSTFHRVADRVHRLPYGRNGDPRDVRCVLEEGRGTCSTKHALLAALAQEHGVELPLMLGIFEMDAINTPAVTAVLRDAGLPCLPEAHCFLLWGKTRVDLTGLRMSLGERHFLVEERIRPGDIVDGKARRHREYLERWRHERSLTKRWSVDALWAVRERCMMALVGG